ncbi:cation:proton antiporter regulatory subunit [Haloarchaeobius sp. DFWS5]|uniref:cation:proton antiporter regulatory subunit n=1 Tax=Haloarchaeobius sp. DFWS5 TaxID=3446114 RepID=UPI003EC0A543
MNAAELAAQAGFVAQVVWPAVGVTTAEVVAAVVTVLGYALLAAAAAATVAVVYRWYSREQVPEGVAILVGLAAVALVLNADQALQNGITGANEEATVSLTSAVTTVASIIASAIGAGLGRRFGDSIAANAFAVTGAAKLDREVSQLVQAVGRVVTVTLPEDIEEIDGYDPVDPETKADLAETTFVFPRRITVAELRDRVVTRLKDDYGVGHVDVDIAEDGTVEYLAVGSRAAGLGPTLAPGTVATAVQADPADAASPGDAVQVVERTEDGLTRHATAELRATKDDVVTLALDETDAELLSDTTEYRLVTLPAEASTDREFASLLRAADETMGAVAVDDGSPLVGLTVGALDVTVAAVRSPDGTVTALPPRQTTVEAGATIYVIARPDELRAFEAAAKDEAGTEAIASENV